MTTPPQTGQLLLLGDHVLREPIEYTIEYRFPGVGLYCAEFNFWGSGETMDEALLELRTYLYTFWSDAVDEGDLSDESGVIAKQRNLRIRYLMGT